MSWFSSSWQYRHPISVDKLSAGTSAVDITIALPSDWPEFWDNVQSNGEDVRLVDADGTTLLTYDLNSFNSSTKVGTLEVQSWTPPAADCTALIWVYWGNAGAADAKTTFSPSTPRTGTIYHYRPVPPIVRAAPEPIEATQPRARLSKTTEETLHVWWRLQDYLAKRRCAAHEGHLLAEEVGYVYYGVESGGSEQASEMDETATRFALDCEGDLYVRTLIKAGASDVGRTINLRVGTTQSRVLNPRALIEIRDTSEA